LTRILLTGASGQLGWELARSLLPLGTVIVPERSRFDLERPETLAAVVDEIRPHILVNAAAYTAVDQAEQDVQLATKVNTDAPVELALAARRHGALFVHYSTDYVFDGGKTLPYLEDDPTNPLNAYGRGKLQGEEGVRTTGADHLIFRTSWIYSARGKNFLLTILRLARERETLRIVNDQIGAPTWARLVAETTVLVLFRAIVMRCQNAFESAVLNLTASGAASWYEFSAAIVIAARERGAMLKCREIVPIATQEYPLPAKRPANSRLSCERLQSAYGLSLPAWEACLQLVMDEVVAPVSAVARPGLGDTHR
jgi:dTDP-4-dehydrorhamnose reductase